MHIAVNITLQDKTTGQPWKIKALDATTVHLVEETGDEGDRHTTRGNMAFLFEEFGPMYELGYAGNGLAPRDPVHMERCPFCGSTHLDPEFWMAEADDVNRTGPGCNDCGAQAESVDAWNKRALPPEPVAVLQIGKGREMQLVMPKSRLNTLTFGEYLVYRAKP